jgi:hypothetical protein
VKFIHANAVSRWVASAGTFQALLAQLLTQQGLFFSGELAKHHGGIILLRFDRFAQNVTPHLNGTILITPGHAVGTAWTAVTTSSRPFGLVSVCQAEPAQQEQRY